MGALGPPPWQHPGDMETLPWGHPRDLGATQRPGSTRVVTLDTLGTPQGQEHW